MPTEPSGALAAVQMVTVDEGQDGQRVDNFLAARLRGLPRSLIYRILRTGEVRVNRGRVRQDYRLQPGDVVRIPPLRLEESPRQAAPHDSALEQVRAGILYEDEWLLVLDKPAGLAVHGGSGLSYGIIEVLRVLRPRAPFLELVHRLDRETSGCLLVAKRRSALRHLHERLRQGQVKKRYLALVRGGWVGGSRWVDLPLRKSVLREGERIVEVREDGKPSRTRFTPLAVGSLASLMLAEPDTGRTHQIRVHARAAGHPLAGDPKYGDEDFSRALRAMGLRRLFLHAWSIEVSHPKDQQALRVAAPLDPCLERVLAALGLEYSGHV